MSEFLFQGAPSLLEQYMTVVDSVTTATPELGERLRPIREQRSRDYPLMAMTLRGNDMVKNLKRGTRVSSRLKLKNAGNYGQVDPGEDWTWAGSSSFESIFSHWREHRATQEIDKDELRQTMDGVWDERSFALAVLNIEDDKKGDMWTQIAEVMEDELGAAPDPSMELPKGLPRSLWSVINECQVDHGSLMNGLPVGFTTQHNVDPRPFVTRRTNKPLMAAQRFEYTEAANASTDAGHLVDVLNEALVKTRFRQVPLAEKFHEESDADSGPILTTQAGVTFYNRTARAHDSWLTVQGGGTDMGGDRAVHSGKVFQEVPSWEKRGLFPRYDGNGDPVDMSGGLSYVADDSPDTRRGARYMLAVPKYIKWYQDPEDNIQTGFVDWYPLRETNPNKYVCYVQHRDAIHVEAFHRHALVYPGKDFGTAYNSAAV